MYWVEKNQVFCWRNLSQEAYAPFLIIGIFISMPPPHSRQLAQAASFTENRKTPHFCVDPLFSVNFCDILILTPHDAITENHQNFIYAEKFFLPNRLDNVKMY
jgi:hypothetical protein